MKRLQVLFTHAIFISFCAVALAFQTTQLLQIHAVRELFLLIFLSTCFSYNLYRLISLFPFNQLPQTGVFFRQHITALVLLFLSGSGMVWILLIVPVLITYVLLASAFTLIYYLPLFPVRKPHWFQYAGFMKTLLLAGTWAVVTVFWPVAAAGLHPGVTVWLLFLVRFSFMFILCVIFDARDMEADQLRDLGSLVTAVSPFLLKAIAIISFVCYTVSAILLGSALHRPGMTLALLLTGLVTWIMYKLSRQRKDYWFYYFGVDGLMLLSAFSTFLATI